MLKLSPFIPVLTLSFTCFAMGISNLTTFQLPYIRPREAILGFGEISSKIFADSRLVFAEIGKLGVYCLLQRP